MLCECKEDEISRVYIKDQSIFDKLVIDNEIIVSGIIEKNDYGIIIKDAKFEKRDLRSTEKVTSSISNPIQVQSLVKDHESNSSLAKKIYSGNLFIEGIPGYVRQDYDDEEYYLYLNSSNELDPRGIKVILKNQTDYPHIIINSEKLIIKGKLEDISGITFKIVDSEIVKGFTKNEIPTVKSSMKNLINGEKLIDDFEENTARARIVYSGRIFVDGFSDGVKEYDGSTGTSFYLKLKGTKVIFDMDYVYIELIDNKQYQNIQKWQKITASGILGEVRNLGASLKDSKIIIK